MSSSKVKCTCGWSWNKSDSSKKDMYICHECGRDNSNNIPKAQIGIVSKDVSAPLIPYSNEYTDSLEKDYLKLYNDPNTRMDDGFDAFYHSMVDSLPDVTTKAKGWVVYKPGTDIEEFTEDDGNTTAPIPGKNRMVKRVEDYEISDRPDTTQQRKLASYMQERVSKKLYNRSVSNKGYDTDVPKQKNGGWLDNYNDSEVSFPEGYVGEGYNTSGRDYSPAWGGQFQDGGLIPMAQNGRATRADSLDVYNRALKIDAYYENLRKKGWYGKPKIERVDSWLTSDYLTDQMKKVDKESRKTYKEQSKENKEYSYLRNAYPKTDPKTANLKALKEHVALTKGTKYATKDNFPSVIDPIAPTTVIDTRIIPKERVIYEKSGKRDNYKTTPPGGSVTSLYRYDPLSVKPWDMLTDAEKKLRVEKYGTDGVPKSYLSKTSTKETDKPVDVKPQLQPRVEALNLRPIEQTPINIPVQELDFNTPIKAPKSYNVSSQRTNVNGINDFYNNVQQGVDYEQALKSKQASDAYNKYIQEKYGNEDALKNPKAVERLKQLKQNVEIVPQYQMGGKLTFLQPTSEKLPQGYRIPYADPSSELAMSIGGENGEPAYLIPSFKYGRPLENPMEEFKKTGEHLGGPFKTWQEADQWEQEVRHPYVEKGQAIPMPIKTWGEMAMGGSIPGSVGFTYARTNSPAPSNGKYAKKTMASAQEGKTITVDEGDGKKRKILTDSKEYADLYNEDRIGVKNDDESISFNPLNEVVVTPYDKEYPFYQELSDEEKKYFNSDSPIGRQLRSRAQDNVGFNADKAADFAYGWMRDLPLASLQAPQSALVEGVEAIRGNDFNMLNALEPDKQRIPSETWGVENPYAAFAVDALTDPETLAGISLLKNSLQKGVKKLGNIKTSVAPELKEFIPTNSNIKQLVNTKINNTSKAIEEHMSGLQQGLFSKTDKRPFFEKFPITNAQKQKVYAAQDKALEEGEQFIKDWHYGDDIDLHPDIVKRMQELDPNFNLSIYDNTNITDPANPFAATNNVLSSTRRNTLKNENLSDYAKEYILDNRNKIGGVNIKDTNESITLRNRGLYHYSPSSIKDTVIHEAGHTSENLGTLSYRDPNGNIVWGTKPFNNIRTYDPDLTDYYIANPNTEQGKMFQEAMVEPTLHIKDADGKITKRGYTWEASPAELHSELLPARSNLIDAYVNQGHDRKEIMDMLRADPSDDQIDWMIASKDLNRFFKKTTSPELKRKAIRMLYTGVPTSVGIGAASQMGEEKPVPGMRKGGVIKDNMGQWNHPGEITEIGSNQITMQGVPYPVLGVSDEGDVQMMYPEEEYKFKGKKVTEFPMAKNGIRQEQKGLVNLDQLTNFTNYNTKQPGGWMDKYQ